MGVMMDNNSLTVKMENCSTNLSFIPLELYEVLQTGILASYLITMVIGLIGNGLVIYVIGSSYHIRTKSVANYYIWNLAFADLFFVLTLPFFCYATYYDNWPFGDAVCKLATVFQETNRYASVFTLVALSFDRYLASFYNMGHLRTVRVGIAVCCIIWILCGTLTIPFWIVVEVDDGQCRHVWSTQLMSFWTFFQLSLGLLIPLILICASYFLLALRLRKILNTSTATCPSIQKPSRKMTRTVLVVVITFLVCQTPYHAQAIINLRKHYQIKPNSAGTISTSEIQISMYLNTISTILIFISSCCNPIIYGILNDNYRKQYQAVMCSRCLTSDANKNGVQIAADRNGTDAQETTARRKSILPALCRISFGLPGPCHHDCNHSDHGTAVCSKSSNVTLLKPTTTDYPMEEQETDQMTTC